MGWSPHIHTRFHVPRITLDTDSQIFFLLRDYHPLWSAFPGQFFFLKICGLFSPNPRNTSISGLGSSYFARHYSRNRVFFLFLQVLRCFSSLRSLPTYYFTHTWIKQLFFCFEFPHSDICGYNGCLLLPTAFRSLPRPSSALGAQGSALRSLQLNLFYCFLKLLEQFNFVHSRVRFSVLIVITRLHFCIRYKN